MEVQIDDATGLDKKDLYLAATYIIDAKNSRNYKFKTDLTSLINYHLYNNIYMQRVLYFFVLVDLSLSLFEEPALFAFGMPYWSIQLIEFVCLTCFVIRMVHQYSFTPREIWWCDLKNILLMIAILAMLIDMVVVTIVVETGVMEKVFRWSRLFRPLFLVTFPEMKVIWRSICNICRSLLWIIGVIVLLFILVFLFALLGRELFADAKLKEVSSSKKYFADYWENVWKLYILVTTANSPDVMMPAYDASGLYMIYFVIFVLLFNFILMNIFLAVIYKSYRNRLKNEVRTSVFLKRRTLAKAWDILQVTQDSNCVLRWERWQAVMAYVLPKRSKMEIMLLWKVLDDDDNGYIEKREFLRLVDLLNVKLFTVNASIPFFQERMPSCYNSRVSKLLCRCVKHKCFRYFFDILIFVNVVLMGCEIDEAEWCFLAIFVIEIILKIYVLGFYKYFRNYWNVFDFVVVSSAFVITTFEEVSKIAEIEVSDKTLDFILSLQALRIFRVIQNVKLYQVITSTIINIWLSFLTFGGVLFIVFYFFAIIGMGVFGNRIGYSGYGHGGEPADTQNPFCGTNMPNFTKSEFYSYHYCNNNFNNIVSAFLVLFELMIVNQWHVIASGFVLVTNIGARVYFIIFHLLVADIVVNIFTVFIVEVFQKEYSLSKNKIDSAIEKKINELGLGVDQDEENQNTTSRPIDTDELDLICDVEGQNSPNTTDHGLRTLGFRFHIGKQRNVLVSMQAVFEEELDDEDMGPEELDDMRCNISSFLNGIIRGLRNQFC